MNPFSLITDLLSLLFGGIWGALSALFGLLENAIEAALVHLTTFFDGNPAGRWVGGFGLAVMVVTAGIRLILSPAFTWQMRTQVKVQEDAAKMKPHIAKLRKEYAKDKAGLAAAQQALYKEHGQSPFSPLAGCLPLLVQGPMMWGLYRGIIAAVKQLTNPAERHFLWIHDLGQKGVDACCTVGKTTDLTRILSSHWTVVILPLMAASLTVVQSKMMLPPPSPTPTEADRMQQQMGQMTTYIIPVFIMVFAMNFPQGLAIYWVTQSSWMIAQQYHLLGWGQMPVPAWVPGAHRQTPLSVRKIAAITGRNVEAVKRDRGLTAAAAAGRAGGTAPKGNQVAPDEGGGAGAGGAPDSGPSRPSGRAKSRSSRPQNRKRRR